MSWNIVPLAFGLGAHAAEWNRLNQQAFHDHPMLTSAFIDGLLKNFGDGRERLCRFVENGQVRAMCILKQRNKLLWSSFLPSQGQIGATLIPDETLLLSLVRSLPGPVMQLDLLCNDPAVGAVLKHSSSHHRNHAFTMNISLDGSFEQYWASRSRRLQSNIRRYEKRLLNESVTQRYVRICAPDEMQAAVERYARLEGAGWKGVNGSALASSAAQLKFYLDAMTGAAASGHACVHELWFGEDLAASRLILSRDKIHVMLKTTYAEKFASYAPGRLLLRAVIQDAFANGSTGNIEFCTDAAPDLLGWATDQRWVQHASLYRSPLARQVIWGLRALRMRRAGLHNITAEGLTAEVFSHPDSLPADAQKLMNRGEKSHLEFGTSWYRNLVDTAYAGDTRICFYTLRRADKTVAVLPLRAQKVSLGWALHSLSNACTTLYEPVFEQGLKPQELGFLLMAIQRDFPDWTTIRLEPMNPHSSVYQTLLDSLQSLGWLPFQHVSSANWYQAIVSRSERSLAERHAEVRSAIAHLDEKFVADGGRLEIVTELKDMPTAVAAFEDVCASATGTPPFPGFLPGLLRTYAESGCLRLGLAWLHAKPVAAQLWAVAHGRAVVYKVARNEAFKDYAADTLLSVRLTEYVTELDGVSELAHLDGEAPYKNTWISHRRERRRIVVHNPRSLRGLAGLARESLGGALRLWRERSRDKSQAAEA